MILAAFIIVAVFFAVYTLSPFFEKDYRRKKLEADTSQQENLMNRKNEVLEAIRDLEYDYKMQKVTDEDYVHLKEKLSADAVELMKKLDHPEDRPQRHAEPARKSSGHAKARS